MTHQKRPQMLSRRQTLGLLAAGTATAALPGFAHAKAPMLGLPQTDFRRFKLGAFEVTIVRDGAANLAGPFPAFGADQFEEDVHELMAMNHLPLKRFELPYAPVLVNTGQELVLIDAGNGSARKPDSGHLLSGIAMAGYTPDQVDVVVITHCHPDHIGGLMEGGSAVFPNARYVCGSKEYDFWSPKERAQIDPRRGGAVQDNVVPLAPKMTFIKGGDDVVSGIRAIDAFGHTPGHLAYHVESEGKRLLVWGDAVVHHVVSFQRPDWPLAADIDETQAAETRRQLLGMAAADGIAVTGYHLPFPAVGFVDSFEDAYRFVPASYQFDL